MQYITTSPERSGIILLKLKRKLEFRGHVYFQPVRPQVVLDALKWLKTNNPLYSNIGVDIDNIDTNLTTLQQNENVSEQNPVLNTIGGVRNNNCVFENYQSRFIGVPSSRATFTTRG